MDSDDNATPTPGPAERDEAREWLKSREAADFLDGAVQQRFGELIGRAVLDPKKQWW
jgi:hypothetical protein